MSVGETMPRENVTAVNRQHPRVLHLSLVPRINQGSGILQQLLLERGAARSLGIPWSTELFAPHAERSSKKPLPRLTTAFNENIWPSLQSRGWKDEPLVDKGTRFVSPPRKYVFKEKTVSFIVQSIYF